jgi:hypothetical protein
VQAASYVRDHRVAPQKRVADRRRRASSHVPALVRKLGAHGRTVVVDTYLGAPPPLVG